jgi:hypothetical protein
MIKKISLLIILFILSLSFLPAMAFSGEIIMAGTVVINGGDRGKSGEFDKEGDVIAVYNGQTSASNSVEIEVAQGYGLLIEPATYSLISFPGQQVRATYTIENAGNGTDSVSISIEDSLWQSTTTLSSSILPPGGTGSFSSKVQVPGTDTVSDGDSSTIRVKVASSGNDDWGYPDVVYATMIITVDAAAPNIVHTQTITQIGMLGNKVLIEAAITDATTIERAELHYGIGTPSASGQMFPGNSRIYSAKTAPITQPGTLTYRIYATDGRYGTSTRVYEIVVNPTTTKQITSQGGTVTVVDGNPEDGETQIRISAGEIAERATVSITYKPQQYVPSAEGNPFVKGDKPVVAYDFSLSTGTAAVTITLLYLDLNHDGLEDTTGEDETTLKIFHWSGEVWEKVGGIVNPIRNTITVDAPHLSLYGIFPVVREPRPEEKIITPNDDGINDYAEFHGFDGSVKIYDITGRLIRTIENTDRWDGRDDDGNIVESGIYIYQFKKTGQRISGTIIVVK